jgi:hypothetical protein
MKSSAVLALISAVFLALLAMPANAQATRTWISGVGDDVNPCSRTAPCKTFAGAISKTTAGGEINCLDPGGFGAVTITKAITLICGESGEAGVLVSSTPGITVAAGVTDKVVLQGLDIQGIPSGTNGVNFTSGLEVDIIKCTIQGFTTGVNVTSNTTGARVFIKDSVIAFNGGGVNVQGNGVGNVASVYNTLVESNTTYAVQATNANNVVAVANSVLNGSPAAISLVTGGTAVSFGPSNIISGTGAFTSTIAFK